MAKLVIIGAGVMGTSLSVPAADNGHEVVLVGSPLDHGIIDGLKAGRAHPKLDAPLPPQVRPIYSDDMTSDLLEQADVIIAGVASPGIDWFCDTVNRLLSRPRPIAFVTKGLDHGPDGLTTYAGTLPGRVPMMQHFIGIGGPCIARELANRLPTACIYACADLGVAQTFADMMSNSYYRLSVTTDAPGVEACAALKNFFAIGVSAMQTAYVDEKRADRQAKNPTAFAFSAACREMAALCTRLGGDRDTAFGLAGLGDLHVTVGGGRNSKLGHALGLGSTIPEAMSGPLNGETVEGVDTARALSVLFENAVVEPEFPLARAIIAAVLGGGQFSFDFSTVTVV